MGKKKKDGLGQRILKPLSDADNFGALVITGQEVGYQSIELGKVATDATKKA